MLPSQAIPRRIFDNQRAFMWISSVASVLVWLALHDELNIGAGAGTGTVTSSTALTSPLCFMFVLSDEPTDAIFLRKYVRFAGRRRQVKEGANA